jgi:hypothetical protein
MPRMKRWRHSGVMRALFGLIVFPAFCKVRPVLPKSPFHLHHTIITSSEADIKMKYNCDL